jgi:hypothetical protein
VRATVVEIDSAGAVAKPLLIAPSPYSRIPIGRRTARRLELRLGEVVNIEIDPVSLRTRRVRRAFGEPHRAVAR